MTDRCAMLALPRGAKQPEAWPMPELVVPADAVEQWRARRKLGEEKHPIVALCPGAVGPGKRWPHAHYARLARDLSRDGVTVWVLGGPQEGELAAEISGGDRYARNLTGEDLRDAILALAAADAAVSNDSGLLHVAAAIGTKAIGLFGPTSPWEVGPLNPLAAAIEAPWRGAEGDVKSRSTEDVPVEEVLAATRRVLKRG
jgi:heptosyltransferase-2